MAGGKRKDVPRKSEVRDYTLPSRGQRLTPDPVVEVSGLAVSLKSPVGPCLGF